MRLLDWREEVQEIMGDFQETIRRLRMERAVMRLTLQQIALNGGGEPGRLARETLEKLDQCLGRGKEPQRPGVHREETINQEGVRNG